MEELAHIDRTDSLRLVVGLEQYKGRWYLDVRNWYRPEGSQEYKRTRKGIRLNRELLELILPYLETARAEIERREEK